MAAPAPGALGRPGSTLSVETEAPVASQESGFSTWRWPSQPGKLPLYVQRAFAVKMFAVLAVQLLCCLALTLPVHSFSEAVHLMETLPNATQSTTLFADVMPVNQPGILLGIYYGLSVICMITLAIQWWVRTRYPCNYFCATVSTVLVGVFFGISDEVLLVQIHMRLLCQVITTMIIAGLSCFVFLREGFCKNLIKVVLTSIVVGWMVATLAVLLLSHSFDPVNYIGKTCTASLLAAFVLTFLLVHAWNSLMYSKVDDLVGIVAVMDASLLSVVSLPFLFLLLAFCAPSSALQVQHGQAAETEEPHV